MAERAFWRAKRRNIVCFRFADPSKSDEALNALNSEIVMDLQEAGIAAPSTTKLGGRLAIRVNITNHHTRCADLDLLVEAVVKAGEARLSAVAPV